MATKSGNAFVIIIEYHVPDDLACLVCCISSPAPEGGQLKFDEGKQIMWFRLRYDLNNLGEGFDNLQLRMVLMEIDEYSLVLSSRIRTSSLSVELRADWKCVPFHRIAELNSTPLLTFGKLPRRR